MADKVRIRIYDVDEVPEEVPLEIKEAPQREEPKASTDIEWESESPSQMADIDANDDEPLEFAKSDRSDRREEFIRRFDRLSDIFASELDNVVSRTRERRESFESRLDEGSDRIGRISSLGREFVEDVYYGASGVYSRSRYNKNRESGREIKVNKKE